jgi:hypothetical protein
LQIKKTKPFGSAGFRVFVDLRPARGGAFGTQVTPGKTMNLEKAVASPFKRVCRRVSRVRIAGDFTNSYRTSAQFLQTTNEYSVMIGLDASGRCFVRHPA